MGRLLQKDGFTFSRSILALPKNQVGVSYLSSRRPRNSPCLSNHIVQEMLTQPQLGSGASRRQYSPRSASIPGPIRI